MEYKIYLLGGYHLDRDEDSRHIYELDIRNQMWKAYSSIPRKCTANVGAFINRGYLHVVGGHGINGGEFSLSCERLDLSNGDWTVDYGKIERPMYLNGFACIEGAAPGTERIFLSSDEVSSKIRNGDRESKRAMPRHLAQIRIDAPTWALGVFNGPSKTGTEKSFLPDASTAAVSLALQRCETPLTALKNNLFVCGGFSDVESASIHSEVFHISATEQAICTSVHAMAVPRGSHCVLQTAEEDSVLAIGGTWRFGCRASFSSGELYHARMDRWSFIAPMSKPRRNFCATMLNGQVYAFGGFDGRNGIWFDSEMYDLRTKSWKNCADIPECIWNYAIAS